MENLYYSNIIYLVSFLITLIAQIFVSSSYSRYKKILNSKDNTGYDTARKILDKNKPIRIFLTTRSKFMKRLNN